jgi:hypothetical protein
MCVEKTTAPRVQLDSGDHPSWASLTSLQRRRLRSHHVEGGCHVPWPICHETDALLYPAPSFLIAHPNMRFKITLATVPLPRGQAEKCIPLISENAYVFGPPPEPPSSSWHEQNSERYRSIVPLHLPILMQFAVVGETIFTPLCAESLFARFDPCPGVLFDWPKGRAIGVCPGTGETVQPDYTTVRLLVACVMAGTQGTTQGTTLNIVTRIMPRILTLEGYERMMGPAGPHRSLPMRGSAGAGGGKVAWEGRIDFYPTLLRSLCGETVLPVATSWASFIQNGSLSALETFWGDRFRQPLGAASAAHGLNMSSGPVRGRDRGADLH